MGKTLFQKLCFMKCCVKHLEHWLMIMSVASACLMIVSMFTPRWRVDTVGTGSLEKFWVFNGGINTRAYGLLQVRGSYSQSWSTLSGSTCTFNTLTMVSNAGYSIVDAGSSITNFFKDGGNLRDIGNVTYGCGGKDKCVKGFTHHLWQRCHEYEKVFRVSMVTMGFTFLAILLILAGVLIATLTNRKRTGGISFGLFIAASVIVLVVNAVWAVISDIAFKNLGKEAWFPYPSLAIGYFMHLYGALIAVFATGCFGYVIIPQTWSYDPEQEKKDKRNRRLQKMMANKRMPNRPPQAAGPMNFPGQPGFAAGAQCQGGAPGGLPPQFAQMQMMPPAGPQDGFGMAAPNAPPQGGGAYHGGAAPGPQPQTYGAGQTDFGMGAAAPQSGGGQMDFGVGAAPQQQQQGGLCAAPAPGGDATMGGMEAGYFGGAPPAQQQGGFAPQGGAGQPSFQSSERRGTVGMPGMR